MGNFDGEKGPTQDMQGHVRRSIYSKPLSRGQNRYGADADWGVLDRGTLWRNLANTTERSACCGDAALRQSTFGELLREWRRCACSDAADAATSTQVGGDSALEADVGKKSPAAATHVVRTRRRQQSLIHHQRRTPLEGPAFYYRPHRSTTKDIR